MVEYASTTMEKDPPEKERQLSIAAPSCISHDEKPSPSQDPRDDNWHAVAIRPAGARGNGVFAKLALPRGHKLIVETPILSCVHWTLRNGCGRRTVAHDWAKLPPAKQLQMRSYFSRSLAGVPLGRDPLEAQHRRVLERFVEEYAFWDPQRARAHVYLLVSHINHACVSCANAEQWTDSQWPHRISVKLVKPVAEGEEVLINYGRRTPFGCAVCGPQGLRDRVRALGCGLFG